ncbi:MAG: hypothetical protein RL637_183 [Pseudomonadota bacterium]|jgi:Smg protein
MKENVFDVLMYLFENYLNDDTYIPNSDQIHSELLELGFEQPNIYKAFNWLESLNMEPTMFAMSPTFRIFSDKERAKLDLDCQDLLLFLERNGVLSAAHRELVIDRAMALDMDISLEELKWIILMVLLTQSNDDEAFSRMEDLAYELSPTSLH